MLKKKKNKGKKTAICPPLHHCYGDLNKDTKASAPSLTGHDSGERWSCPLMGQNQGAGSFGVGSRVLAKFMSAMRWYG